MHAQHPNESSSVSSPPPHRTRLLARFGWLAACLVVTGLATPSIAQTPLETYDASINADAALATNPRVPVATLTTAVTLNGNAGAPFDFGPVSGDATLEFIVEGDPSAGVSAFLAVGTATPKSRLVYEIWNDTTKLGFTQGGVADYQFSPAVPSPVAATHLAYVWDPGTRVMELYVNGGLAGTRTDVDAAFVMPSGAGFLGGANATADEAMKGTIHRVTVYDEILPDSVLKRHAGAYGAHVSKALAAYDAAVTSDAGAGLNPTAKQTSTLVFNGSGGTEFDFGAVADDATLEFILEGDPSFGNGAYLAVGENTDSNLRYEVWGLPDQIGFTLLRVADYNFSPAVAAPTLPTHVAYAWDSASLTMKIYVNGALAGTAANINAGFSMPTGAGRIGSNPSGVETMSGTVYRVTAYDSLLNDAAIGRHAKAFADLLSPPTIVALGLAPAAVSAGETAALTWEVKNATKVTVNGVDRTGTTRLDVSAPISGTFTLIAENPLGKVSKTVRLQVNPNLAPYDAALASDDAGGLKPVARLTAQVAATGDWAGVPFDFGATYGDVTMEFILEGDPTTGAGTAIATDYDDARVWRHSLRYSQWDAAGQIGFTKRAVADYAFTPPVPASTWPTHLAFVWDSAALALKVYVNGSLAGTKTDVSPDFAMPTGMGTLGDGTVGTIFRVAVYSGQLPEAKILAHSQAFLAAARPTLNAYDKAIATTTVAGTVPTARLLAPVTLPGDRGITFHFGTVTGDGTLEFILEGDPAASTSSYLAVGSDTPTSRLVFESWPNSNQLGFTQGGVADYLFTPAVPTPTTATHVAYVWTPDTATMKLYLNGALAGSTTGVDAAFVLPAEAGSLGSAVGGGEPMTGTLHRVTVYDSVLTDAVIQAHASAFASAPKAPVVALDKSGALPAIVLSSGVAGAHYRVEYRDSLSAADAWKLLQDIPSLTGTTANVTDTTAMVGRVQRYYRAVLVP